MSELKPVQAWEAVSLDQKDKNKGVWDGYMSVLYSHQQSALPFQVDGTDVRPVAKNRGCEQASVKCRHTFTVQQAAHLLRVDFFMSRGMQKMLEYLK